MTPSFGSTLQPVHYIPILTTIISFAFAGVLLWRYVQRGGGTHLLWWGGGMFIYGLGTAFEASITLFGNTPELTKGWYIVGAILGGYPLAQGSVYFHFSRRTANILSAITLPVIIFASVATWLSPIVPENLLPYKPGGAALAWTWVRMITPFINTYAVIFLIGSAIWSAVRYASTRAAPGRALGNALIAFGALLPGIGGTMAKAGVVEALYIGEFFGAIAIWFGYRACTRETALLREKQAPINSQSHAQNAA